MSAFQITLRPSGNTFTTDEHTNVLQAALDAGFTLPYGCKSGACGSCKATVLSGEVDHGKSQESTLPLAERAQADRPGKALLCCATARSDVQIKCREIDSSAYPVRIMPTRVQRMQRLAPDVMALTLKLPINERLKFRAGQYIEFMLKDGKRRAFSLANAPHEAEFLELHIRHMPGGHFTDHVFSTMKEKDILRLQGPLGTFYLREESDKPIILLAGGTGFAPIKSLIEHALYSGITRPISVYWGARDRAGLYLHELPLAWSATHSHVNYVPVLSDEKWEGRRGFVHQAVLQDHADLAGFQVYACGAPAMIDAARADFTAAGLPDDEFFADSFTFAT
jgi:CDP-4-dehydro-6-deoxyglucose reductase, E3